MVTVQVGHTDPQDEQGRLLAAASVTILTALSVSF